jgi:hypothetical protein
MGNKIVLKGFTKTPLVEIVDDVVTISAGEPCEASPLVGSAAYMAMGLPFVFGRSTTGVLGSTLIGMTLMSQSVKAQSSECSIVPIEVEIYVDASSDEIVMRQAKSGDFEVCPPESK